MKLIRRFIHPYRAIGPLIIIIFILIGVFAPIISPPPDPDNPYRIPRDWSPIPNPPSREAIFGTGEFGVDLFYGVVWGTRMTLQISTIVVVLGMTGGVIIGAIAGFYGGPLENFLMRITDIFFAIPGLILAMATASILGGGIRNVAIALAFVRWPQYSRLIRGEVLRVKNSDYVTSAKALGGKQLYILRKHILPNSIQPIFMLTSVDLGRVVLSTSALGFLGVGAPPGTAEWGILISMGRNWLMAGSWWVVFFPGAAIALYVLAWSFVGDTLRDFLDPTIRER